MTLDLISLEWTTEINLPTVGHSICVWDSCEINHRFVSIQGQPCNKRTEHMNFVTSWRSFLSLTFPSAFHLHLTSVITIIVCSWDPSLMQRLDSSLAFSLLNISVSGIIFTESQLLYDPEFSLFFWNWFSWMLDKGLLMSGRGSVLFIIIKWNLSCWIWILKHTRRIIFSLVISSLSTHSFMGLCSTVEEILTEVHNYITGSAIFHWLRHIGQSEPFMSITSILLTYLKPALIQCLLWYSWQATSI